MPSSRKSCRIPLLFNQSRSASSELAGLSYRENALHVDVVYSIERPAITVDLFGGPSIFFTETELVTNVTTSSTPSIAHR